MAGKMDVSKTNSAGMDLLKKQMIDRITCAGVISCIIMIGVALFCIYRRDPEDDDIECLNPKLLKAHNNLIEKPIE